MEVQIKPCRAFCLSITALFPVVSSWACLSLATSGCLIIYNNIFKQSCLWVCSCRAWRQCGLVIKDSGTRVGVFFLPLGGWKGVCCGIRWPGALSTPYAAVVGGPCRFFCDGDNGGKIPKKGTRCFRRNPKKAGGAGQKAWIVNPC